MAVMEYILVRGAFDMQDPYPMQGIELQQIAEGFGLERTGRMDLRADDSGWELLGDRGIVRTEVVYHPGLLPERLMVRTPEGGDLKATYELALDLGEALGANVFNRTTGEQIADHFPGKTAAGQSKEGKGEGKGADLSKRKGCGSPSVLLGLFR